MDAWTLDAGASACGLAMLCTLRIDRSEGYCIISRCVTSKVASRTVRILFALHSCSHTFAVTSNLLAFQGTLDIPHLESLSADILPLAVADLFGQLVSCRAAYLVPEPISLACVSFFDTKLCSVRSPDPCAILGLFNFDLQVDFSSHKIEHPQSKHEVP